MLARLLCCPWSSVRLFASAQGGSWKAITNYFYFTPQLGRGYIEMEWPGPNQDIVLKGNYFIGDFSRKLLGTRHPLYFRTIRFAPTGIGWHLLQPIRLQAPTGTWTFVQPNKYEPGRANIAIYNWSLAPRFRSNVTGAITPGTLYQILDAQNYLCAPVASGTYDGSPISIPTTA